MEARVLSWTRVDRPPAGFAPGRVIVLVEGADGARHYVVWVGREPPEPGASVTMVERSDAWVAE